MLQKSIGKLLGGECKVIHISFPNNKTMEVATSLPEAQNKVILCGVFNPMHKGHRQLLQTAKRKCDKAEAYFEMSMIGPDGEEMKENDPYLMARIIQFQKYPDDASVIIMKEASFIKKAKALPGSHFVIGYDIYERLVDPKTYGN